VLTRTFLRARQGAPEDASVISLPDVDELVLRKLLEFIYTGDVVRSTATHYL
jgi:hypothetical protein